MRLPCSWARRCRDLDAAAAHVRHATQERNRSFLRELEFLLGRHEQCEVLDWEPTEQFALQDDASADGCAPIYDDPVMTIADRRPTANDDDRPADERLLTTSDKRRTTTNDGSTDDDERLTPDDRRPAPAPATHVRSRKGQRCGPRVGPSAQLAHASLSPLGRASSSPAWASECHSKQGRRRTRDDRHQPGAQGAQEPQGHLGRNSVFEVGARTAEEASGPPCRAQRFYIGDSTGQWPGRGQQFRCDSLPSSRVCRTD